MVNMGETVQGADPSVGVYSSVGSPTQTLLDTGEEDQDLVLLLERRSFRPFKSSDDYLYAMKEDLGEWLNGLYDLNINVDNFFERLENGVILCEHANNVKRSAEEHRMKNPGKKFSSRYEIPNYEVHFRRDSAAGSFFARDNIHNFIRWCRDLGVHDVLMFETDDLVLRKNEKHVILALLEIARRGARFGMAAPLLIQMEDDIDREIEKDRLALEGLHKGLRVGQEDEGVEWTVEGTTREDHEPPNLIYGPQPQVITNDLMSLDEMVRDLVGRCNCPTQFPMIKVSEGKYRIGDTKVLIFVRILRNHVMVRVGGGWDTLHHYLDKHDPCRCRAGHRSTISAKVGFKHPTVGERDLRSVTYERSEEGYTSSPMARRRSNGFRRESNDGRSSVRQRSQSPALRDFTSSVNSPKLGGRVTSASKEDQSTAAGDQWCDSSSEVSDEGYKSQGPPSRSTLRTRRVSPKKPSAPDLTERPDSSMTQLSSEGSSVSAEDIGLPPSPPHSPPSGGTPSNPWNSVPKTPFHNSRSNASTRNKSPFADDLQTKKTKSKSLTDGGKRAWNAGPGLRPGEEPRSRRSSVSSDAGDGRKITRSRSATSEGGFQNMLKKESGGRQSLRSGASRIPPVDISAGKNTWNGRIRQRDYPTLYADTFRPPPVAARSIRSSSASPATTRKIYTSSAPVTPLNRSPKRSNPSAGGLAPPLPPSILSKLPEINTDADGDAEILLQLEGFVNNYRAYVLDKLAAEGRAVPPELAEEELETEGDRPAIPKDPKFAPMKPTPRKSGLGSRIPAPVF